MRTCARCERQLPIDQFSRSAGGRDGLHSYCKECMSAYMKAGRPPVVHPPRPCAHCGEAFVPKDKRGVFCSRRCKQGARWRRLHPTAGRVCQACGKDISHMRADSKWCDQACSRAGRPQRLEINKRSKFKTQYGMSLEDYAEMLERQGGVCAFCGTTEIRGFGKQLAVDHCHDFNRVRGILCGNCNRGIGNFNHDPALLAAAAEYLG
jgi:hypothetical protein